MASVSVVLPVYNGEQYLGRCLDSVFGQTYSDLEVIIVDDGSTDGTSKIIWEYSKSHAIKTISHGHNWGVFKSLNEALASASGEYVCFIAYDDWWSKDKISSELMIMSGTSAGVVYSDFYRVAGGQSTLVSLPDYDRAMITRTNFVNISSCMVRRAALDSLFQQDGYHFDENLTSAGDADFWARLSRVCDFKHYNRPLAYYFQHPKQISRTLPHHRDRIRVYLRHNRYPIHFFTDLYIRPGLRRLFRK